MGIHTRELLQKYLPFDKSVPYKDLLISPIRLKDIYDVQEILNILQIDKNNLGQIEFISMSKLRFILAVISNEVKFQQELYTLLYKSLSIPDDDIINVYVNDDTEYLIIGGKTYDYDIIDEDSAIKITAEDFDEIVRIILYQNIRFF